MVSVTLANAKGTYTAYIIVPDGKQIDAENIDVITTYQLISNAVTGSSGSVKVSAASFDYNQAIARTDASSTSCIEAAGIITTTGYIKVFAQGEAHANADVITSAVNISGASIAVNLTEADAGAQQQAYITLSLAGSITAAGDVNVESLFTSNISATVGAAGKSGVAINIIGVEANHADAKSEASVSGKISGSGYLTAANVYVKSDCDSAVQTVVLGSSGFSLLSIGDLEVSAQITDNVYAAIGGNVTALTGNIEVYALSNANLDGTCSSGVNITLAEIKIIKADASLGASDARHTVQAEVLSGAMLAAEGDIIISAKTTVDSLVLTENGLDLGGITIGAFRLNTSSYSSTEASVGNNVQMTAGGSVLIKAEDNNHADTSIQASTSIGIIYAGEYHKVANYINQNVSAVVGSSSSIFAKGTVDILSYSIARMDGSVHLDQGGLISDGDLDVINELVRSVTTLIGPGSNIASKFADITISAEAGTADSLRAVADGSSSGFVGVGEVETECNVISNAYTTVSEGVYITSTFATVEISAYNSTGDIYVSGDYGAAGVGAAPSAYADSANTQNNATVQIGRAGDMAYITGKTINLDARVLYMNISTYTNAVTTGFDGTAYATSEVTLYLQDII